MGLTDFIKADSIFTDFEAENKPSALRELCLLAARAGGYAVEEVTRVIMEREALGSTGVGLGVALPHGQSPAFEQPLLLLARSRRGVDFDSLDGRPVYIFVLALTPPAPIFQGHLKILARLGRLFQSPDNVRAFMTAADQREIFALLAERDRS